MYLILLENIKDSENAISKMYKIEVLIPQLLYAMLQSHLVQHIVLQLSEQPAGKMHSLQIFKVELKCLK